MAHLPSGKAGRGASPLSSVGTICNTAIGSGVLSLPLAVSKAGLIGGLLVCLAVGCLEASTLYVLSKFGEHYRVSSYGHLVRTALGRKLSFAYSFVLIVFHMGTSGCFMVIMGDTFVPLVCRTFLPAEAPDPYRVKVALVLLLSIFVIFPLCLPRRLKALEYVSGAALVGFVYTATVICTRSFQIVLAREVLFQDVRLFSFSWQALMAIPIVANGFACHVNVVSVFNELADVQSGAAPLLPASRRSAKLVRMQGVIISAFAIIVAGYAAVGVAGYLAFPENVAGNIFLNFAPGDALLEVARVVIGCIVLCHYPVIHFPARRAVEDVVVEGLGWVALPRKMSLLFTVFYVGCAAAISLAVDDLSQIASVMGGTAVPFLVFFVPGLLLVNSAIVQDSFSARRTSLKGPLTDGASLGQMGEPLLRLAASSALEEEEGILKTGLFVYSSRASWWAGMALVLLSAAMLALTTYTSILAWTARS